MPRGVKRARELSVEAPDKSKKQPVLTLSNLASYDDVLTDALVDRVYFWSTIRKNRARFAASRGIHEDDITDIIRKYVIVGKDAPRATNEILQLSGIRKYVERLEDEDKREHFRRHLRKYINIYLPDCPFEVSTTNRYTIDTQEASITARTEIRRGEVIKYLSGLQVPITKAEEKQLQTTRGDFSIVVSSRKKTPSMFLGPARFANHDCQSNARLSTTGTNGMQIVAQKDIDIGDEITVTYGVDYFGEDNCECLCATCERLERNGWGPQIPSEDEDEDEDEDEEKTPEEVTNARDQEDASDEDLEDVQPKTPYSFRRPRKYGSESESTAKRGPETKRRRHSTRVKRKVPPESTTNNRGTKRRKVAEPEPEKRASSPKHRGQQEERRGRGRPRKRPVSPPPTRGRTRTRAVSPAMRTRAVSPPATVKPCSRPTTHPINFKDEPEHDRPISDIPLAPGNEEGSRGRAKTRDHPTRGRRLERSGSSGPRSDTVSAVFSEKSASSTPVSTPDSEIRRTARAWKPSRRLREIGVANSIEVNMKANITIEITTTNDRTTRVESPESALTSLSQIDADENHQVATRRKLAKVTRKKNFNKELMALLGSSSREIKTQTVPSPAALVALSTTETATVSNARRPGDYTLTTALLCSKYSRWVTCNTCDADFVQEDAYLTRKECPRCERHSKLYGYAWPKTDREGRWDTEERVLDHRTIHRFIETKEEKLVKRGRKSLQVELLRQKRLDSEESERLEELNGGRRLRARSRSVVGVRMSYREEDWE